MTTVNIGCPAGSGMNFALNLLRLSYYSYKDEFLAVGHQRKDILEPVPTLVILRNPYDAVASAAERWLRTSDHHMFRNDINLIEDSNIVEIVKQIQGEKLRYLEFFENIHELEHVKILSFDLLTKNPDRFVSEVGKHFSLESEITKRSDSEVVQSVIDSGNENRVPREKSYGRIKIDRLIRAMYPEEEFKSLEIYLNLKKEIDKEL